MPIESPDFFSHALLRDGWFYAQAAEGELPKGLTISVDPVHSLPLVPLDPAQIAALHLPQVMRPDLSNYPPEMTHSTGLVLQRVDLKDWRLPNTPSLQLCIAGSERPGSVRLPISLPIPRGASPDDNATFAIELATHRCDARLRIHPKDDEGRSHKPTTVAFLPCAGGTWKESWQSVEIVLPHVSQGGTVEIELLIDKRIRDENPPYLFLSDPRIKIGDDKRELMLDVSGASAAGASWFGAPLPAQIGRGNELYLYDQEDRSWLLHRFDAAPVEIIQDDGHTVIISSPDRMQVRMTIGNDVEFCELVAGNNEIRWPSQYLTGSPKPLRLHDVSGAQLLLDTWILPPRALTSPDMLRDHGRRPIYGFAEPASEFRYAALRQQIARGASPSELANVYAALEAVEQGAASLDHGRNLPKISLKPCLCAASKPKVSVVMPAHNQFGHTYLSLASLVIASGKVPFEVIVVDDGSTDRVSEIENHVSGLRVVRNTTAQRFIRAINGGAAKAEGDYIVLLNNDVEVTVGWMEAMLEAFEIFSDGDSPVGAVGAKLVFPDGKLQDAGGLVWNTGVPWNYGRGGSPNDPRFSYAREADYVTGAALMTTRKAWDEVGGLSAYLEPMYYDDADYAFKMRDAGYKVIYAPAATVFHYEGATSGTDLSAGAKAYQATNAPKFRKRWARAFKSHGREGDRPDMEKDRPRVGRMLFTDHVLPRPDRDAGSYATVSEMRLAQALGYKVTFMPLNLAHLGGYTEDLERQGIECVYSPFYLSVDEFLAQRGAEFDAVYMTRWTTAHSVLDAVERHAPQAIKLFNNCDLHFLRELRAGVAAKDADMIAASVTTRERELEIMKRVDLTLTYNEVERHVIFAQTEGAVKTAACPWLLDIPPEVPPLEERSGLSFLGGYGHPPNREAVKWFVENVMPLLSAADLSTTLYAYGSGSDAALSDLLEKSDRRLTIGGWVEKTADAYDPHIAFVAPLISGAGIKGKVLGALASGTPCILSPVAAEGTGVRDGHDCLIARTPNQWVEAIRRIKTDEDLWHKLSKNARELAEREYSFKKGLDTMREAFETAGLLAY